MSFLGVLEKEKRGKERAKEMALRRKLAVREQEAALARTKTSLYLEKVEESKNARRAMMKKETSQQLSRELDCKLHELDKALVTIGTAHNAAAAERENFHTKQQQHLWNKHNHQLQADERAKDGMEVLKRKQQAVIAKQAEMIKLQQIRQDQLESEREDARNYKENQLSRNNQVVVEVTREPCPRIARSAEAVQDRFPAKVCIKVVQHTAENAITNDAVVQEQVSSKGKWQRIMHEMRRKAIIAARARAARLTSIKTKGAHTLEDDLQILEAADKSESRQGRVKEADCVVIDDEHARTEGAFEQGFLTSSHLPSTSTDHLRGKMPVVSSYRMLGSPSAVDLLAHSGGSAARDTYRQPFSPTSQESSDSSAYSDLVSVDSALDGFVPGKKKILNHAPSWTKTAQTAAAAPIVTPPFRKPAVNSKSIGDGEREAVMKPAVPAPAPAPASRTAPAPSRPTPAPAPLRASYPTRSMPAPSSARISHVPAPPVIAPAAVAVANTQDETSLSLLSSEDVTMLPVNTSDSSNSETPMSMPVFQQSYREARISLGSPVSSVASETDRSRSAISSSSSSSSASLQEELLTKSPPTVPLRTTIAADASVSMSVSSSSSSSSSDPSHFAESLARHILQEVSSEAEGQGQEEEEDRSPVHGLSRASSTSSLDLLETLTQSQPHASAPAQSQRIILSASPLSSQDSSSQSSIRSAGNASSASSSALSFYLSPKMATTAAVPADPAGSTVDGNSSSSSALLSPAGSDSSISSTGLGASRAGSALDDIQGEIRIMRQRLLNAVDSSSIISSRPQRTQPTPQSSRFVASTSSYAEVSSSMALSTGNLDESFDSYLSSSSASSSMAEKGEHRGIEASMSVRIGVRKVDIASLSTGSLHSNADSMSSGDLDRSAYMPVTVGSVSRPGPSAGAVLNSSSAMLAGSQRSNVLFRMSELLEEDEDEDDQRSSVSSDSFQQLQQLQIAGRTRVQHSRTMLLSSTFNESFVSNSLASALSEGPLDESTTSELSLP